MRRSVPILLLVAAFSVAHTEAGESEVNVLDVVQSLGGILEWDSLSRSGTIVLGHERLSFAVGRAWFLGNGRGRVETPLAVRAAGGAVLIDEGSAEVVAGWFAGRAERGDRWRVGAILVDPGHGGRDPGACANHTFNEKTVTVREKDIVLEVGLRLERLLRECYPEKNILLSRRDDTYLTLEERTELANAVPLGDKEAIIFVSVHANSALVAKPRGYEVWVQPPAYRRDVLDEEALSEEDRELWPILNSMREDELNSESEFLAEKIMTGLGGSIGDRSPSRGIKQEAWAVVRNAIMPAVLVEVGFLNNPEEAALLVQPEYQQAIAEGIFDGIAAFTRKFEGGMNFVP